MTNNKLRTYTELILLNNFNDRYNYLKLDGRVGEDTFGHDRYINQSLYRSEEWRRVRQKVITRDLGCDLGITGRDIPNGVTVIVHHMNPITKNDIINNIDFVLNPEYLITTTKNTHDAIHYGSVTSTYQEPIIRTLNDTCPWKK